ncbi:MAG: HAMP domain-containing histidine kinase, partial [Pirellulales bacterium]|nr:HAMP domain-containing histidine kinase [Pirellulales bacterium]
MQADQDIFQEQFLNRALHDLKAPARHVVVFSELLRTSLRDGQFDGSAQEFLDVIERAGRRMQLLLETLGDLLRLPNEILHEQPVDLRELLEQCWHNCTQHTTDGSGELIVEGNANITTDPRLLAKIFQQLFDNSLRYPKPQVPLQVLCLIKPQPETCGITIKDNGRGISPEMIERMLRPFERYADDTSQCGAGLGLTLCQRLIQRLGGTMALLSDGRSGTT